MSPKRKLAGQKRKSASVSTPACAAPSAAAAAGTATASAASTAVVTGSGSSATSAATSSAASTTVVPGSGSSATSAAAAVVNEKSGAEHYQAILNLKAMYFHTLDSGDPNRFAALWTTDGELIMRITHDGAIIGHEALKEHCVHMATVSAGVLRLDHNVTVHLSEDAKSATSKSYFTAMRSGSVVSMGRQYDTFMNDAGVWKFKQRVVDHQWTSQDLTPVQKGDKQMINVLGVGMISVRDFKDLHIR